MVNQEPDIAVGAAYSDEPVADKEWLAKYKEKKQNYDECLPGLQITVGHRTMSDQIWQKSEQNQILMGHYVRSTFNIVSDQQKIACPYQPKERTMRKITNYQVRSCLPG